jgi:hypothetical protein
LMCSVLFVMTRSAGESQGESLGLCLVRWDGDEVERRRVIVESGLMSPSGVTDR